MALTRSEWCDAARAAGARPAEPCSENALTDAEQLLGRAMPDVLRRLYEVTDGVFDEPGQWWVLWPLQRVVSDTRMLWSDGSLSHSLVAFGDDWTGNPFCVDVDGAVDRVVRWSWIDAAVDVDEGSFADFLGAWVGSPGWPPEL